MTPDKGEFRLDCKMHSGIRAEVDDLKDSDKEQWNTIKVLHESKVNSSHMKWVIGVFLVISLAVVGFLWNSQVSSTNTIVKRIEVMDDKNTAKREETDKKLESLKENMIELRWTVDQIKKK